MGWRTKQTHLYQSQPKRAHHILAGRESPAGYAAMDITFQKSMQTEGARCVLPAECLETKQMLLLSAFGGSGSETNRVSRSGRNTAVRETRKASSSQYRMTTENAALCMPCAEVLKANIIWSSDEAGA